MESTIINPKDSAEKAAKNLFRLPINIARMLGTFPFFFNAPDLQLQFSWKSLSFSSFYFLIIVTAYSFAGHLSKEELSSVFDVIDSTELRIIEFVNLFTAVSDFLCLILMAWNSPRVENQFSSLIKKTVFLWTSSAEELTDSQKKEYLNRPRRNLSDFIGFIFVLSTASFLIACSNYGRRAWELDLGSGKMFVVFFVTLFWIVVYQVRLATFSIHLAYIFCIAKCFQCLRTLLTSIDTDHPRKDKCFMRSFRITWIMQQYDEVEKLLEEFQQLFSFHLITACFSTIFSMVYFMFQLVECLGRPVVDVLVVATLFAQGLTTVGLLVTLCHASSGITDAALGCISGFRNSREALHIPESMQTKVLLFYTSALAKPPRVAPGKLFVLGKQVLSEVKLSYI